MIEYVTIRCNECFKVFDAMHNKEKIQIKCGDCITPEIKRMRNELNATQTHQSSDVHVTTN